MWRATRVSPSGPGGCGGQQHGPWRRISADARAGAVGQIAATIVTAATRERDMRLPVAQDLEGLHLAA